MPYRTITTDPTEYPDGAPLGEWVPVDIARWPGYIEFREDGLASRYSHRQLGSIGAALGLREAEDPIEAGVRYVHDDLLNNRSYGGDPKPYLALAGPF